MTTAVNATIANPLSFSQSADNAVNAIIYPPNYDPTTQAENSIINPSNTFADNSGQSFAQPWSNVVAALPQTPLDWYRAAIFAGVFILALIYFGTYLVKHV
jgi:hypothetical protein